MLLLIFVLYGFAVTNFVMALTTLFSNPKLAGDLGGFVFNLLSVLYFLSQIRDDM